MSDGELLNEAHGFLRTAGRNDLADVVAINYGKIVSLRNEIDRLRAALAEAQRDAERYRWMRDRNNSLETRQYDKGIYNGPSCYHEVDGIRELKSESKLDAAIDAAILATKEGKKDERM